MKIFRKNKVKNTAAGKEAKLMSFMAPVDPNDESLPDTNDIVSHQHNSHTIFPKIPGKPAADYKGWENTHLVDFPGMFDCKGILLDIPMEMALQRILKNARSSKLVVIVSASILLPDNARLITEIKKKLENMFKNPEQHVVIAVTKA